VSVDTSRCGVNAIQEALTKHRQEKAMLEKRIAGDQQRMRELDAIIDALEAIPVESQEQQSSTQS
jgi:stalled ribosome rescue protein Dom34